MTFRSHAGGGPGGVHRLRGQRSSASAEGPGARSGAAGGGGKRTGAGSKQGAPRRRPAAAEPSSPVLPDVVIEVASPDSARQFRRAAVRRKLWNAASFFGFVLLPTIGAGAYLQLRAADQFVSSAAFAVRSADAVAVSPMAELLGNAGDSSRADSLILYEYLQSQPLVERIDADLDLRSIYRKPKDDAIFSIGSDDSVEWLVEYWNYAQTIAYDGGAGIVYVEIRAFDPEDAHAIAEAVTAESERLINDLSAKSRHDAIGFALADLREAEDRVRDVRFALQSFRGEAGTADVSLDIRAAMELLTELRGRRAALSADYDARQDMLGPDSPVLSALRRQITAVDAQIAQEEARIASATPDAADVGSGSLAAAAGRQEELLVELHFAETMYTSALAAVEAARAEARRSQRYLAVHIAPTTADTAEHPRRWTLTGAVFVAALILWSIMQLIVGSIRDRA